MNGICLTCARLRTRRWLRHARRWYLRELRAENQAVIVLTAFGAAMAVTIVLYGIFVLLLTLTGYP
jgi:hypothetical protein